MTRPLGSSAAYKPRAGGNAERSINHLRANGETTHHDLANALDVDASILYSSLALPIQHGLILRNQDRIKGTISYYVKPTIELTVVGAAACEEVPAGTPVIAWIDSLQLDQPTEGQEVLRLESDFIHQVIEPSAAANAPQALEDPEVTELAGNEPSGAPWDDEPPRVTMIHLEPEAKPMHAPVETPAEAPAPEAEKLPAKGFRCAYYSDDQFVIMDDEQLLVLDAEKTRTLFAYVRSVLRSELTPTAPA